MRTFVAFTKASMLQLPKIINRTLSVRLSLIVVFSMAILLMASLTAMLHYSRKSIKEEALQKASQTLEGTVQRIDNILLGVEQSMGNIYFNMLPFLNQPDMMFTCCRELVEANTLSAVPLPSDRTTILIASSSWPISIATAVLRTTPLSCRRRSATHLIPNSCGIRNRWRRGEPPG